MFNREQGVQQPVDDFLARHRKTRLFDFKRAAFNALRSLTDGSPFLRRMIHFYPERAPPACEKIVEFESRLHWPAAQANKNYRSSFELLSQFNVDSLNADETALPRWSCLRKIALISDCVLPGHLLTPVDACSAKAIHLSDPGATTWNYARPMWARKTRVLSGTTIALPRFKNYYHVLVDDIFPLLFALAAHHNALPRPVNIVMAENAPPIIAALIEHLQQKYVGVIGITAGRHEVFQLENLLYLRAHFQNKELSLAYPEMISEAKNLFLRAYGLPDLSTQEGLCVYIARGSTSIRRVEGEGDLISRLRDAGFHILTPSWSNHAEQVSLCSRARFLAGVHGAGLTNVLWAPSGAMLCEIMAHDARKRVYLNLAAEAGVAYSPVFGGREGERQNFSIEPNQLADVLIENALAGGRI
jgi:hypothetical protein